MVATIRCVSIKIDHLLTRPIVLRRVHVEPASVILADVDFKTAAACLVLLARSNFLRLLHTLPIHFLLVEVLSCQSFLRELRIVENRLAHSRLTERRLARRLSSGHIASLCNNLCPFSLLRVQALTKVASAALKTTIPERKGALSDAHLRLDPRLETRSHLKLLLRLRLLFMVI